MELVKKLIEEKIGLDINSEKNSGVNKIFYIKLNRKRIRENKECS